MRRFAVFAILVTLFACAHAPRQGGLTTGAMRADTTAMFATARILAADSLRGRGPWTPENTRVARMLATRLATLGAQPVFGSSLLVPFTAPNRPQDTVYNVVGVLPSHRRTISGETVGITAHFDHLGVGKPDATGDSIYNGFLDAALPVAMVIDVARRYVRDRGDRPLVVMFFNLEEQGLLGSKALVARADAASLMSNMKLLIGVDAGSPSGEAMEWQLMGPVPPHRGSEIADSIAHSHGWTTTSTPPRAISDVFPFSQHGVPILFPIPGKTWRGYSDAERATSMSKFDHYHQPADEARSDFPLVGTAYFADWLWSIVRVASRN